MSYYKNSYNRGGFLGGLFSQAPMVRLMLLINVGVFLFEMIFGSLRISGIQIEAYIQHYLYLFPPGAPNFYPWQLISYMFLHGGFMHILFNMLALVIFGPSLEMSWGSRKFLIYYFLCGLGGGIAHVLISPFFGGAGPLVGASGAIFGLLAAFGLMFPDQIIYVNFFIPMKAKYMVLLYILLEVISVPANDGVGHLAHLGGAVVGIVYLLIAGGGAGSFKRSFKSSSQSSGWKFPQQPFGGRRHVSEDEMVEAEYEEIGSSRMPTARQTPGHRVITQEDIDRILDKIAASGYQNLTEEERQILFEASRKMDERGR